MSTSVHAREAAAKIEAPSSMQVAVPVLICREVKPIMCHLCLDPRSGGLVLRETELDNSKPPRAAGFRSSTLGLCVPGIVCHPLRFIRDVRKPKRLLRNTVSKGSRYSGCTDGDQMDH